MKLQWENARIKRAFLGREDHGIFTVSITFEGESWSQTFGNRVLSEGQALFVFVDAILTVCGADSWDRLQGLVVQVGRHKEYGLISAIRPLIGNWPVFYPTDRDNLRDTVLCKTEQDLENLLKIK